MIFPEGFLPEKEWKAILRSIPIPRVDVVVEKDAKVLLGVRMIRPYRNRWALPRGRIIRNELQSWECQMPAKSVKIRGVRPFLPSALCYTTCISAAMS